jgi:hypothetical protein
MIELTQKGRFGRLAPASVPVSLVLDFLGSFLEQAKAHSHRFGR